MVVLMVALKAAMRVYWMVVLKVERKDALKVAMRVD
jgi:hypothetical protein